MKQKSRIVLANDEAYKNKRLWTADISAGSLDIPIPKSSWTEFDLQAELYSMLKSMKLCVHGEVEVAFGRSTQKCRFDLVVFSKESRKAVVIVECKTPGVGLAKHGRQEQRYTRFNATLILFNDPKLLQSTADRIRRLVQAYDGKIPHEPVNTEEECVIVDACS